MVNSGVAQGVWMCGMYALQVPCQEANCTSACRRANYGVPQGNSPIPNHAVPHGNTVHTNGDNNGDESNHDE